jgi:hypothetical protein
MKILTHEELGYGWAASVPEMEIRVAAPTLDSALAGVRGAVLGEVNAALDKACNEAKNTSTVKFQPVVIPPGFVSHENPSLCH